MRTKIGVLNTANKSIRWLIKELPGEAKYFLLLPKSGVLVFMSYPAESSRILYAIQTTDGKLTELITGQRIWHLAATPDEKLLFYADLNMVIRCGLFSRPDPMTNIGRFDPAHPLSSH